MIVSIELTDEEEKFLKKICHGYEINDFIQTYLKNNLFNATSDEQNNKYELVKKLMFLHTITQSEMAEVIGLNQSSLARALKEKNPKSSLFKYIEKAGSAESFIFYVKKESLKKYFEKLQNIEIGFDAVINDIAVKTNDIETSKEFLEILCGFCFKKLNNKFTKTLFEERSYLLEIYINNHFQPIFLTSEKFIDRLEDRLEISYKLIEDGLCD